MLSKPVSGTAEYTKAFYSVTVGGDWCAAVECSIAARVEMQIWNMHLNIYKKAIKESDVWGLVDCDLS